MNYSTFKYIRKFPCGFRNKIVGNIQAARNAFVIPEKALLCQRSNSGGFINKVSLTTQLAINTKYSLLSYTFNRVISSAFYHYNAERGANRLENQVCHNHRNNNRKNSSYQSSFSYVELLKHCAKCTGLLLATYVTYTGAVVLFNNRDVLSTFRIQALDVVQPPDVNISRQVIVPNSNTGLKLTLYQYQTCPFCCKVRSFLDYYGFSYDIVEVNSVSRAQIKWSKYKKVPILLMEKDGIDGVLQLVDSSLIISLLETYLENKNFPFQEAEQYFPSFDSVSSNGRKIIDYHNKYNIMYLDKSISHTKDEVKSIIDWRMWVDNSLVHTLSPNIYRTIPEAVESFKYFSLVGEWEKNFSVIERMIVIYVGALAMYLVSKRLAKRHQLRHNIRMSLYEGVDEWIKAVGRAKFHGGDKPDLADLNVYGVLSSIEGCEAFQDLLAMTKVGPWFKNMKVQVNNHKGMSFQQNK